MQSIESNHLVFHMIVQYIKYPKIFLESGFDILIMIWRPLSLSELTPMVFNIGLTHSEAWRPSYKANIWLKCGLPEKGNCCYIT